MGGGGLLGSIPTTIHTAASSSSGSGGTNSSGMQIGHTHGQGLHTSSESSSSSSSSSSSCEGGVNTVGASSDPSFMHLHRPLSPTRLVSLRLFGLVFGCFD